MPLRPVCPSISTVSTGTLFVPWNRYIVPDILAPPAPKPMKKEAAPLPMSISFTSNTMVYSFPLLRVVCIPFLLSLFQQAMK